MSSTSLGVPASGGSATLYVEGLKGSQTVGDQSMRGSWNGLSAEVKWTVLAGDFQVVVDSNETSEADEFKNDKTILGSPATEKENDRINLNVSSLNLFGNNGHFTIEGDKEYLLWTVEADGALNPYETDSKIPTTGISGLSLLLMESGIHQFKLKYHAINGAVYELDKIVLNQRFGAASVADYFWGKYEGPNTQLTLDVLSNDKRDPSDANGQIIDFTPARLGTVILVDQTFFYNTNQELYGTDSFTYTMINQYGERSTSQVVVDIEYVPAVKTGTIQELDAASQQQLLAIHQQYLLTRSQQVLGDTVGVNFKNHRGVAATERLVTIADWGWRIIDGGFEPWAGVSDDDRINTLPGSPGYRTITYFSGWTELHSGRQGDTLIQHPYTSIEISAQIERLIRNQEVTRSFTAYDSSGGSPFYAGAEAFFAHKNTRIAAGVAGIALVVFTGGLSAPFVVGGMTLGGTTITGTGLAGAGIFAASSYAVVRMGDDIEAAINDRQRSLLTQGLDQITGYISNDPRTLTDNLVVSTDLAMFV
ncbi:MAG: hypothetical protein LW870_24565, partial [Pirellula sp.]|nr:hypothetical protein [Pirellula sp.]